MKPKGPYTSIFTTGEYYIIKTTLDYRVVRNGEQPTTGLAFVPLRDAYSYLKDNGFKLQVG